jgi:hypothetical protein
MDEKQYEPLPYGVRPTREQVKQLICGQRDIEPRHRYEVELRTRAQKLTFESAQESGYVIDTYTSSRAAYFAYRMWCFAEGRPFAAILRRRAGYSVELDMTTTYPDSRIPERPYTILTTETLQKLVDRHLAPDEDLCMHWSPSHFRRQSIRDMEEARSIASMLYTLATEAVNACPTQCPTPLVGKGTSE